MIRTTAALVASLSCFATLSPAIAELQLVVQVPGLATSIKNASATAVFELNGYAIDSASGGLSPALWKSLDDQGLGDFQEVPNSSTLFLVELSPSDGITILPGESVGIGMPLGDGLGAVASDVTFQFAVVGASEASAVRPAIFVPEPVSAVLLIASGIGACRRLGRR